MMFIRTLPILALLPLSMLYGCANGKIANNESMLQAAQEEASSASMSPEQAVEQAGQAINTATQQELDFYAPLHMKQARDKLAEAQKLLRKEDTAENLAASLSAALSVGKLLEAAEQNRLRVDKQLQPALEHRDILIELGTPKALPKPYNKGLSKLDRLIRELEGGNFDKAAEGQADLLDYFSEIEARTLKALWLTKAEVMLDKSLDVDAHKFAENSYDKAKDSIARAEDFLSENYRDREAVKQRCEEAYNAAARAYVVAVEAQKIFEADKEEIEKYVLANQALFDHINRKAQVPNLSNHSFYEQANLLEAAFAATPSLPRPLNADLKPANNPIASEFQETQSSPTNSGLRFNGTEENLNQDAEESVLPEKRAQQSEILEQNTATAPVTVTAPAGEDEPSSVDQPQSFEKLEAQPAEQAQATVLVSESTADKSEATSANTETRKQ